VTVELRALVVAYNFPPVGGAGVQRVLKLVKYLPAHGVAPRVLTVSNPSVPVLDASLERDFPPGLVVTRVRTLEPGYAAKRAAWQAKGPEAAPPRGAQALRKKLTSGAASVARQLLFPDPQLLWQPAAQLGLARELARERPDVVFVSGPPFSQFLLAPTTRAFRRRTALVLDYRDEWSTYRTSYEMMGSVLGRLIGDPLEHALLRSAHAITIATEEFRAALLERFPFLDPSRVHAIPNGYDDEDMPAEHVDPPKDRLVIAYAGTIFKLTSTRGFLAGIRRFHERSPELAQSLSVRFMGRIVETEADAFEGTRALGVETLGYLPHDEVLRALAASHITLCVLDDVTGAERIYPAKIFELMAIGRPILTLSPEGALARLVRSEKLGVVLPPRDEAAIAAHLESLVNDFRAGKLSAKTTAKPPARFSRRALAGDFARVFREAVERAR
jgi:glycosyltransferase involved in cell wall biosynthesis